MKSGSFVTSPWSIRTRSPLPIPRGPFWPAAAEYSALSAMANRSAAAPVAMSPGEFEVAKMAVTESSQGAGIGRHLLQRVITEAHASGARRLYLETNRKLAPAIRLNQSMGFRHPCRAHRPFALRSRRCLHGVVSQREGLKRPVTSPRPLSAHSLSPRFDVICAPAASPDISSSRRALSITGRWRRFLYGGGSFRPRPAIACCTHCSARYFPDSSWVASSTTSSLRS